MSLVRGHLGVMFTEPVPLCVCVRGSQPKMAMAGGETLSEDSRVAKMLLALSSLPEPWQWGEGIKETPPPPTLQQK